MFKYDLVWCKTHGTDFMNANRKPLQAHENILVFAKNFNNMTYNPQKTQSTPYKAQSIKKSNSKGYHIRNKQTYGNTDGSRYPLSYVTFKKESTSAGYLHPTQKPAPLLEWLIKTYSNEGDTVLDNCCGSGSTCAAARRLNRHYIGFETDEKYYKMALQNVKDAGQKQITMWESEEE